MIHSDLPTLLARSGLTLRAAEKAADLGRLWSDEALPRRLRVGDAPDPGIIDERSLDERFDLPAEPLPTARRRVTCEIEESVRAHLLAPAGGVLRRVDETRAVRAFAEAAQIPQARTPAGIAAWTAIVEDAQGLHAPTFVHDPLAGAWGWRGQFTWGRWLEIRPESRPWWRPFGRPTWTVEWYSGTDRPSWWLGRALFYAGLAGVSARALARRRPYITPVRHGELAALVQR